MVLYECPSFATLAPQAPLTRKDRAVNRRRRGDVAEPISMDVELRVMFASGSTTVAGMIHTEGARSKTTAVQWQGDAGAFVEGAFDGCSPRGSALDLMGDSNARNRARVKEPRAAWNVLKEAISIPLLRCVSSHAGPPDTSSHRTPSSLGLASPVAPALDCASPACRRAAYATVDRDAPVGWPTLPVELKYEVVKRLDTAALCSSSCTCKELWQLTSSNEVWKPLFEARFGEATDPDIQVGVPRGGRRGTGKWRCFLTLVPNREAVVAPGSGGAYVGP